MVGTHVLFDLADCDLDVLVNVATIEDAVRTIAALLDAVVIRVVTHRFSPWGITCLAIISSSHIAIHTWPEVGVAAVDVFSCTSTADAVTIAATVRDIFRAGDVQTRAVVRGAGEQERADA